MSIDKAAARDVKRRVHYFSTLKQRQQKIVVVTAYDYPTALAADAAGADAILVGDSLGMVALGFDSTIPVTVDMMVHHTAAVRRGSKLAFLIADLPFLSYKTSSAQAMETVARLMQEGGAEAVKMEGGQEIADIVRRVVDAGVPVMGHVGLTPQSVHKLGGYRVQGRSDDSAETIRRDALSLQEAGVFSIVLEAIDPTLAKQLSEELTVPTIGIGASRHCDGQVLVISDLAGMLPASPPKFAKQYANLHEQMTQAIRTYAQEVREAEFPTDRNEY
ncbi:3-methyl-2-oxobutanoate hydroxymethyltransferase [candidate division BRC1 bacterium HGW-BRC1-1]|jgi:3-methyl-2-oxobutanoate hydroxymethyltransferase|nr:MAG: 3-methyl-2-oxobutanoate hydroxymethyltransferase [candidate division BRC1 bacterium HGW-BRC1-1]